MLSSSWSKRLATGDCGTRAVRRTRGKDEREKERFGATSCRGSSSPSFFLALQPRPKKAINRYPSEVIPSFQREEDLPSLSHTRSSKAFSALSRNNERVMHPYRSPEAPNELQYFILTPMYVRIPHRCCLASLSLRSIGQALIAFDSFIKFIPNAMNQL